MIGKTSEGGNISCLNESCLILKLIILSTAVTWHEILNQADLLLDHNNLKKGRNKLNIGGYTKEKEYLSKTTTNLSPPSTL